MPDDGELTPGQGSQADANADAPKDSSDKQVTTPQPRHGEQAVAAATAKAEAKADDSDLMNALGIPKEIQAQLSPAAGEEPKLGDPAIDEVAGKPKEEKTEAIAETGDEPDDGDEPTDGKDGQTPDTKVEGKKPDKVQRRIDKLTREKSEAQAEKNRLMGLLENALGEKPKPKAEEEIEVPASSELAYIKDEKQLNQEIAKATALLKWCNANAKGVEGGDGKFIDPETVAGWKSEAEVALVLAPNRRQEIRDFNVERNQFDNLARQAWPEMFDQSSEEYQAARQLEQIFPTLKSHPRGNYALGVAIEGMKGLNRRVAAANGNGKQKAAVRKDIDPRVFEPRVPVPPHTSEPPSREGATSSQKKFKDAMSQLVKDSDGGAQSLAAVLAAEDEMAKGR